jgi:hypothetical protein
LGGGDIGRCHLGKKYKKGKLKEKERKGKKTKD